MGDDISNEIQHVVEKIEKDKAKRKQLQSDIEDLCHGYVSLEEQINKLKNENKEYRDKYTEALGRIDRFESFLEEAQEYMDRIDHALDEYESEFDMDYEAEIQKLEDDQKRIDDAKDLIGME